MATQSPGKRAAFRDTHNANVYARYADAWQPDRIPSRADLDLFALPRCLPNVYLVDMLGDRRSFGFRVRLMGTALVDHLKLECTGQLVEDLPLGGWEREWHHALNSVLETQRPVVSTARPLLATGLRLTIEHLALPLSKDGRSIDQILGVMAFLGYAYEAWPTSAVARDAADLETSARILVADPALQTT